MFRRSFRRRTSPPRGSWRVVVPAAVCALGALVYQGAPDVTTAEPGGAAAVAHAAVTEVRDSALAVLAPPAVPAAPREVDAALLGRSGRLRARFVVAGGAIDRALATLFGEQAVATPGVHRLEGDTASRPFSLVTLVPFERKVKGRIGTYLLGAWPAERGGRASGKYGNPQGFIEVTKANQNTYVSEHFRLRDFLTKDQHAVWPKYLVLDTELIDKLELVIQELEASGTPVRHVSVMSGFRTPNYNANGGNTAGRASNSRHTYGDAADVFVDNDRNGNLDDLNHDGRIDTRDVQVMLAAVERVERRHPDLLGGAGVYRATSAHGPFVHVDVRGSRARW